MNSEAKLFSADPAIRYFEIASDDAPFLSDDTVARLDRLAAELNRDEAVRAVIVVGGRRFFCSGAPLEILLEPDAAERIASLMSQIPHRLLDIPVPTIALMEGHAAGGGLMAGLWCDIPLFAAESLYGANFAALGFTPGMGATHLVEECFGPVLGRRLLLTGEMLKGAELRHCGSPAGCQVMARSELPEAALRLAQSLSEMPLETCRLIRRQMVRRRRRILSRALPGEIRMHRRLFALPELRERIARAYVGAGASEPALGEAR